MYIYTFFSMYLSTRCTHWHPSFLTLCWCARQVVLYSSNTVFLRFAGVPETTLSRCDSSRVSILHQRRSCRQLAETRKPGSTILKHVRPLSRRRSNKLGTILCSTGEGVRRLIRMLSVTPRLALSCDVRSSLSSS